MSVFEFPPPPPPPSPRRDPREHLRTPERDRQEVKSQTAVNWFIGGFYFSRASSELQAYLYMCLHQQFPRLQLKDDANYRKVQRQAPRAAWEITQRNTKHSVDISWTQVVQETESRLDEMRNILNNDYILSEQEYHLVLYRMVFLLVGKEAEQLHAPTEMPPRNRKWQLLLGKLRKELPRTQRKDMRLVLRVLYNAYGRGEAGKYIESPESDPWWSHVCGYLMNNDGNLFKQSVDIPPPFRIILDHLRWALCQVLTGNIFSPWDTETFTQNLDTVIRTYNDSPHPHQEVNLIKFRQWCMYGG